MITGAHAMIFSKDAQADRAFLRDVLGLRCIDSGGGWLIFAFPEAELGVHDSDENDVHQLYLMTDGLDAEIERITSLGGQCSDPAAQGWGRSTNITLPGGGKLGLYEPRHARP